MKGISEMENQKKANEREIDLAFLFKVLKKAIVLMIVAAMFFGAIGIAYSVAVEKPKYQGTVTFWVANNSPDANYTSQSLVYAAAAIASSCIELVKQDMPIREAVRNNGLIEKLGYETEDKCVAAVKSMISARKEDENSLMFYVTVQADTKEDAYDVAKAIEEVMPGILNKLCSINSESISMITATGGVNNPESVKTIKSSPITTAIILGFVAAVATYAVFFVLSIFDVSIYDENTVKDNFSYPIIGNIPSFAGSDELSEFKKRSKNPNGIVKRNYKNKLLAEDSPFFMTESFNTLRTNVIYSAAAAKNPIFAVTSDVAAVGKTVVASNLAIALSSLGKKVLLVECDMRCPTFSKLFKIKKETGLSELLAGISDKTADVAVNYNGSTLDILLCGQIPPNPSELLAGYRMTELAEEWKSAYDYVILDMPPIGEVYDASVVANVVNGYIVTVRVNHSNINDVRTATERIESVNGAILGIIVNGINPKSSKKYKYYYSYGEKNTVKANSATPKNN